MWLIALFFLVVLIWICFEKSYNRESALQKAVYKELDHCYQSEDQEEMIQNVFNLARDRSHGLWRITFLERGIILYERHDRKIFIPFSELGYQELPLQNYLVLDNIPYYIFLNRLKRAADKKDYIVWEEMSPAGVKENEKNNIKNECFSSQYLSAVNVCTRKYYESQISLDQQMLKKI